MNGNFTCYSNIDDNSKSVNKLFKNFLNKNIKKSIEADLSAIYICITC